MRRSRISLENINKFPKIGILEYMPLFFIYLSIYLSLFQFIYLSIHQSDFWLVDLI